MSLKFGEFELDQERRQLLCSGRPVPLEPKAYELLSLLVERRPRALSRAQIRDVVWPDTFVSESTLGVEVNAIRQALGDDARDPRFIRTVRGFGYAFCGEVDESEDRISGPVREAREDVGAGGRRRRARLWGALGALLIATAVGWWALSTGSPDSPAGPITITPLTSDGGGKACPQLSPDGERVAYSWTGTADDNWDIYVKAVGIGTRPLRLTEHEGRDWSPVWSPDGRQIAFLRRVGEQVTIFTVPSLGGQERRLIEVAGPSLIYNYYDHSDLSWSPDGRTLAYAESTAEHEPARIVLLSLDSMEKHALTSPAARTLGDQQPAFSPDGTQVAFVRSEVGADTLSHRDVWVQAVDGGDAGRLTREEYDGCNGPAWTSRGTEILFSAGSVSHWVYRVATTGGQPELVAGLGE